MRFAEGPKVGPKGVRNSWDEVRNLDTLMGMRFAGGPGSESGSEEVRSCRDSAGERLGHGSGNISQAVRDLCQALSWPVKRVLNLPRRIRQSW